MTNQYLTHISIHVKSKSRETLKKTSTSILRARFNSESGRQTFKKKKLKLQIKT